MLYTAVYLKKIWNYTLLLADYATSTTQNVYSLEQSGGMETEKKINK